MNDGQKSINSGIQELIKGITFIECKRTENGIFNGYEYLVYERPPENGLSENGLSENRKGELLIIIELIMILIIMMILIMMEEYC